MVAFQAWASHPGKLGSRISIQLSRYLRILLMTDMGVRRDKAALSSGCKAHPARSLQPEATGAGMEATKCLKPLLSGSRFGARASLRAATRLNAEQSSKRS